MKRTTIITMIVSPIMSYTIALGWAFIDDTLIDGESPAVVGRAILWIVAHSISLGHLLLFLLAAMPAAVVPKVLGATSLMRPLGAARALLATVIASLVPVGLCGFIFHTPTAIAVGLVCGVATVFASYLLSASNQSNIPQVSPSGTPHDPREFDRTVRTTFGRRS